MAPLTVSYCILSSTYGQGPGLSTEGRVGHWDLNAFLSPANYFPFKRKFILQFSSSGENLPIAQSLTVSQNQNLSKNQFSLILL
jgi:hypothetical protein